MSLLEILFTQNIQDKETWGNICDFILDNHASCKEAQMVLKSPSINSRYINICKFLMRRGSTKEIRKLANKVYKKHYAELICLNLRHHLNKIKENELQKNNPR